MNNAILRKVDFTIFFNNNYNHLVIYLMRYVHDLSVAQDIAQDIFVTVWEKRDTITSPQPFLFVCARNAAYKYLLTVDKSKISINESLSFDISEESDDELIEYFERLESVNEMINKLPPQCKEVVKKVYFEKKKLAIVAQEMNLSINTIKTHIKVAKKHLVQLSKLTYLLFF